MKAPSAVHVGDLIDGKYRIEAQIGAGAMAVVYSAHHMQRDERVALKFLDPKLHASAEAKARFAREARASFSLRSEHVARVMDVGVTAGGTPFMVMELLLGDTLEKYVEDNGPLPLSLALSFAVQATRGVAVAHASGIVHRDIKPENLFVTPRPSGDPLIRVLDFGISKELLGEREGSLTGTNDLIGTPSYMAPEQFAHAKTADPRADVWSLGILLYWLLTGTTPFDAPTPMGIMSAILTRKPTGASLVNPRVTRDVDDVILHCITRDRAGRFDNAAALLRALEPLLLQARKAEEREEPASRPPTAEEIQALEDAPTYADSRPPVTARSRTIEVPDEYPVSSRDVISVGPVSGRTAVMVLPQRLSAPPPEVMRASAPPPAQERPSTFDRTYPLSQHGPLQLAANALRASAPPPAPRPSHVPRDSQWSDVSRTSMQAPQPSGGGREQRTLIITAAIVFAVVTIGGAATLALRGCAKPPPSSVQAH